MSMHPSLYRSPTSVILVDAMAGAVIGMLALVLYPITAFDGGDLLPFLASGLLMLVAVALRRFRPAIALPLVWLATIAHMTFGLDAGLLQLGILAVLVGAAHYGSRTVLVLSGVSVPVGSAIAVLYLISVESWVWDVFGAGGPMLGAVPLIFIGGLIFSALAVPWLIGLLARAFRISRESRERRAAAEREAQRSAELAHHERARTELARDVHDIVGHSLAVIVAQAESVRFIDSSDSTAVRAAVQTIADTARRSLEDVRAVLETTGAVSSDVSGAAPVTTEALDRLIDDVAAARPEVRVVRRGDGVVALHGLAATAIYRATQELLTNALRHGASRAPLEVERTIDADAVVVRVTNSTVPGGDDDGAADVDERTGTGLAGARARLDAVGGRLDLEELPGGRFRACARVPLESARIGVSS
ncbi:MAG: hypothetical protein KJ659_01985 [Actinobacteria bacterium]|nr:hypothetical protein [Actinomycetota bacterium]MBU1608862.1 hypothetical protein [Actinomycetota bacterium]MBU2314547.1 hypothetical protein [Actinomycetota bacterium]MBU2384258.1 hypothetical protein [Actinomycetota bacterium]